MSSETKWTPGPWSVHAHFADLVVPASHVKRSNGAAVNRRTDRDDFAQVIVRVRKDRHGRGDQTATAQLIASAPKLYEALAAIAGRQRHRGTLLLGAEDFAAIDSALASARGEG